MKHTGDATTLDSEPLQKRLTPFTKTEVVDLETQAQGLQPALPSQVLSLHQETEGRPSDGNKVTTAPAHLVQHILPLPPPPPPPRPRPPPTVHFPVDPKSLSRPTAARSKQLFRHILRAAVQAARTKLADTFPAAPSTSNQPVSANETDLDSVNMQRDSTEDSSSLPTLALKCNQLSASSPSSGQPLRPTFHHAQPKPLEFRPQPPEFRPPPEPRPAFQACEFITSSQPHNVVQFNINLPQEPPKSPPHISQLPCDHQCVRTIPLPPPPPCAPPHPASKPSKYFVSCDNCSHRSEQEVECHQHADSCHSERCSNGAASNVSSRSRSLKRCQDEHRRSRSLVRCQGRQGTTQKKALPQPKPSSKLSCSSSSDASAVVSGSATEEGNKKGDYERWQLEAVMRYNLVSSRMRRPKSAIVPPQVPSTSLRSRCIPPHSSIYLRSPG